MKDWWAAYSKCVKTVKCSSRVPRTSAGLAPAWGAYSKDWSEFHVSSVFVVDLLLGIKGLTGDLTWVVRPKKLPGKASATGGGERGKGARFGWYGRRGSPRPGALVDQSKSL